SRPARCLRSRCHPGVVRRLPERICTPKRLHYTCAFVKQVCPPDTVGGGRWGFLALVREESSGNSTATFGSHFFRREVRCAPPAQDGGQRRTSGSRVDDTIACSSTHHRLGRRPTGRDWRRRGRLSTGGGTCT